MADKELQYLGMRLIQPCKLSSEEARQAMPAPIRVRAVRSLATTVQRPIKVNFPKPLRAASLAVACLIGTNLAQADIGLPVLNGQQYRPHYWDLPTDFKSSFMFPGQMVFYNATDTKFDAHGNKVDIGSTQYATVGLTAIPNVFKFKDADNWAYAFGIDLLEVRMSSGDPDQASFSGVGNVMADFIAWTKPDANSTVGYNVILGTPVNIAGDDITRNTDLYLRGFYSRNINNFNLEAAAGYQHSWKGSGVEGDIEDNYNVNLRVAYDFNNVSDRKLRISPYIGVDHMWTQDNGQNLTNMNYGVQFAHASGMTWGMSYIGSVRGKNAPFSANMLQAQLWFPW